MKYDISKMLRQKESLITVSEDEFFASKELAEYLNNMSAAISGSRIPPIVHLHSTGEDETAYTDGDSITINYRSTLIKMLSGLTNRFKCLLGMLFHELAHVVYMDFNGERACLEQIMRGELPFNFNESGLDNVQKMREAVKDVRWREVLVKLYKELFNFAADKRNEDQIIEAYREFGSSSRSSLIEQCIMRTRSCLRCQAIPIEQLMEKSKGEITINVMMPLIFEYIRFGCVMAQKEESQQCEAINKLAEYKTDADIASGTDSVREKCDAVSRIVARLWPLLEQLAENAGRSTGQDGQQHQSSSQSQGQSDGWSQRQSHGQNGSQSPGQSDSQTQGQNGNQSQGQNGSQSQGQSGSQSQGQNGSQSQGQSDSQSHGQNGSQSPGQSDSQTQGQNGSQSQGQSDSRSQGQNGNQSQGQNGSQSQGQNGSQAQGQNGSQSQGQGGSQSQGQNGQQGQGNQQDQTPAPLTEKDLQAILDALNRYIEQVGKSSEPQNRSTQPQKKGSDNKGDDTNKGSDTKDGAQDGKIQVEKADAGADDVSEVSDAIANALRSIEKKIASNRAANEVSRDIMADSLDKIKAQNMTSAHSRIKVNVSYFTHTSVTPNQAIIYNGVYKSVEGTSKRISRSLEDAMKEYSMGGQNKKLAFGPDFDVTDAYRPDGRFFVRNKLPEDLPEIAVAVLVDQSGSMKGPSIKAAMTGMRIKAAMTMAILVDDFCRRLNIPVLVAGHSVRTYGTCDYNVYTDFDRVKDSAKCNLTRLSDCGGCNRDGLAVSITAGLLQKRPEPVKLLFIISDGQPNDNQYGGELAVKDIQSILTPYRRKGMAVFAAAIGDDKDQVQKIYQDSYLDITDLNALPKTIVKILKKQIAAHL